MGHAPCPPAASARARWLAAFAALLVALVACGGGNPEAADPPAPPAAPPPPPNPVQLVGLDRRWSFFQEFFDERTFDGRWAPIGPERYAPSGEVHEEIVLDPPGANGLPARSVEVYSNATGSTYWVSAETPRGSTFVDQSRIGSEAVLLQQMAFRKLTADATLKFVITHMDIEGLDGNPSPSDCQLQAVDDEDCTSDISAQLLFDLRMVAGPVPNPKGPNPLVIDYFSHYVGAAVDGWLGHWQTHASAEANRNDGAISLPPGCCTDNFEMTVDASGIGARIKLIKPIVINVPLDQVGVNEVFVVVMEADAYTHTYRGPESWISAYLRDPAKTGGVAAQPVGLEPVDVPAWVLPARRPTPPALPCNGPIDPQAGTLQFERARFGAPEGLRYGAPIYVSRTGGSRGEVSATFSTGIGTAVAGRHYTPVQVEVRFADGEEGLRRVRIPLLDDKVHEPSRTLRLSLADPRGCAALGPLANAELVITDNDPPPPPPPPTTYSVGGVVSGLAGTGLVLSSNGSALTLAANGPFTLPAQLTAGTTYDVRVVTQPANPAQACTVLRGSGTIAAAVTDVAVDCVTPLPNGALDPAFGELGKASTTSLSGLRALALQGDGKIVVLTDRSLLARFNADGTRDLAFGSSGSVTVSFNGSGDIARHLAVQSDGRIVVVGRARGGTFDDFGIARYSVDGVLDPTFGNGGKVLVDINGDYDEAMSVLIDAAGRIVVAGNGGTATSTGTDMDYAIVRLGITGALDTAFGTSGRVRFNIAGHADLVNAAALAPDGRIVVVGRAAIDGGALPDTGVVIFAADGVGGSGAVRLDLSPNAHDEARHVAVQADGRIVLGVQARIGGLYKHALARLNADLTLDGTFGNGGLVAQSFAAGGDFVRAVAVQADGRIVSAGITRPSLTQTSEIDDFLLTRHLADGSLDPAFGQGGKVVVDFFAASDGAEAMVLQPDGKIVAGGVARNGASNGLGLVRVLP